MNPETQRKGFELMVREYSEQLYWQIRKIVLTHEDTNDVLQNTFLKAWNAIDTFHGEAKVSTWLSRIAINESVDHLRRNKHLVSAGDDDLSVANNLMADPFFDGSETEAMLQQAIAQLPDVQRTVFTLRYFDDMKYSEISQITNTS
jgi:RNA polymerase sigma-70 factor (ECF subfamily)